MLREHGWFDEQIEAEAMLDVPAENDVPGDGVETESAPLSGPLSAPPVTESQPEPSTPQIKQITPIGGGR